MSDDEISDDEMNYTQEINRRLWLTYLEYGRLSAENANLKTEIIQLKEYIKRLESVLHAYKIDIPTVTK